MANQTQPTFAVTVNDVGSSLQNTYTPDMTHVRRPNQSGSFAGKPVTVAKEWCLL